MDSSARLFELFSKYLQRRCEPEEVAELISLLQEAGAADALDGPMKRLWEQVREDGREHAVDWDRMYGNIRNTEADLITLNHRRSAGLRRTWIALAAACLLGLLIGSAWWLSGRNGRFGFAQTEKFSGAHPNAGASLATNAFQAKRQVIHLPDGSTVILNANSKLDYPAAFTGATREVYLTGEGYFEIVHYPGKPFLVHTGKVTTRVLGTDFNIKAYPSDCAVEVTVTHGKVQVLREDKSIGLLTADQQLHLSTITEQFEEKKVDIRPVIAWKPTEINFDDITMQEAAKRIGERFNVEVVFNNPAIRNCRVTATFYEDDMLNEMLTVICGVSQSNFTIQDHKIVIDGKGCN